MTSNRKGHKVPAVLPCGMPSDMHFGEAFCAGSVKGAEFMKLVCDRLEEDYVVLTDDNGNTVSVPRGWLSEPIGEGDAVCLTISRDEEETLKRQDRIHDLLRKLKEKGSNNS